MKFYFLLSLDLISNYTFSQNRRNRDDSTFNFKKGDFLKAEKVYQKSLSAKSKDMGIRHPEYIKLLIQMAKFYELNGMYKKADDIYEKANSGLLKQIKYSFPGLSENEKIKFL